MNWRLQHEERHSLSALRRRYWQSAATRRFGALVLRQLRQGRPHSLWVVPCSSQAALYLWRLCPQTGGRIIMTELAKTTPELLSERMKEACHVGIQKWS